MFSSVIRIIGYPFQPSNNLHVCMFSIVDEFTDDYLSAHESELDRMRGFYADNVEVFKLVEKRETLWKQKLEMEVSPCTVCI